MTEQHNSQIPGEIESLLARLRRRIRQYVFFEGVALLVVLVAILFWLSFGIDWAYFQFRQLELPLWFRQSFMVIAVGLLALALGGWILLRLAAGLRAKALALVLERRFPELDDRLVTAVEWSSSNKGTETALTRSMLQRTVGDVARTASTLDLSSVFNRRPLRRAAVVALVLLASIGSFAWANDQAMKRWARAYIGLENSYWVRETSLVAKVVTQPGDEIREFKNQEYKHARGADLTLLVEVPEGKTVPGSVDLESRLLESGARGRNLMSRSGERQFRHSMSGVLDSLEFWARGGDFVNSRPYRVVVVPPPRVDQIQLNCNYPAYTRMQPKDGNGSAARDVKLVQGTQVSLPMETEFEMEIAVNKPLTSVRLQSDRFAITLTADDALLTVVSGEGKPGRKISLPSGVRLSPAGTHNVRIPFLLTATAADRLEKLTTPATVPLFPDSLLRIFLEDVDGVRSIEPAQLTVNGIVDQPPVVETELRGIGSSITRKAIIPVTGRITDDYGIVKSRFDFQVDAEKEWRARPFDNTPKDAPKAFRLERDGSEPFERFEVLPLDLKIGQKLTLTVYAEDGDNLNGPHSTRGERFAFKIVSDEELLAILYASELNLRRRFEQIISEVEGTRKDLLSHRTRVEEAFRPSDAGGPQAESRMKREELNAAVAVCAERSTHQVLKNRGETQVIEESFRNLLEELVNNGVHTRQMVDRLDSLIVKPLNEINNVDYPHVDQSLGLFRLAVAKGADPIPPIDSSVEAISAMLTRMRGVLNEMRDLVKFHEALKDLKLIIDSEEKLSDETKQTRKKSLLNRLKAQED